jgi:hypothetical protein
MDIPGSPRLLGYPSNISRGYLTWIVDGLSSIDMLCVMAHDDYSMIHDFALFPVLRFNPLSSSCASLMMARVLWHCHSNRHCHSNANPGLSTSS